VRCGITGPFSWRTVTLSAVTIASRLIGAAGTFFAAAFRFADFFFFAGITDSYFGWIVCPAAASQS
jgi:hypothetical protein